MAKNPRYALKTLLASVLACGCMASQAGGGLGAVVYDPTNWVQNLATAQNTVRQYTTQVEQLLTQYRQYQNMVQQGLSFGSNLASGSLGAMLQQSDLAPLVQQLSAARDLTRNISQVQTSFQQRLDEARLSGLSWDKYLVVQRDRLARRQDAAVARVNAEQTAMKRIETDYQFIRDQGTQISATAGVHQSMQQMNLQINRLLQMNAEVQRQVAIAQGSQAAEKQMQEAEDQAKRMQEEEVAAQRRAAMRDEMQRDREALNNFLRPRTN